MYYYIIKVDISGLLQYLGPFDCFRQKPDDGPNSRSTLPELPCLVRCLSPIWENISAIENTKGVCHRKSTKWLLTFFISAQDTVNWILMPTP